MKHTPRTAQRTPWEYVETARILDVTTKVWTRRTVDGPLWVLVADEPEGWHLSISHRDHNGQPDRYPTWDEIHNARTKLLPADVGFVLHLPTAEQYINVHETTFHLHEHPPRGERVKEAPPCCETSHGS